MRDVGMIFDPLPDGNLCWATAWEDEARFGIWVQHGESQEARRFFPNILHPFPPVVPEEVIQWLQEAHRYRPCKPRKVEEKLHEKV